MEAVRYLALASRPKIKVYHGSELLFSKEADVLKRPELSTLEAICYNKEDGTAEFEEQATFYVTMAVTVDRYELWYDNVMVALRIVPNVYMSCGDSLQCTTYFRIIRDTRRGEPAKFIHRGVEL